VTALLAARVQNGRITEQTDAFVCIDITGPAPSLLALMERLVNLNPQRFAPGSATRTGLHHMAVFVIRRAEDQLAVMGMRSAAGSLWHALAVAAERQAQR
ncbi:MAG: sarcosine oxidase subunit gamma, partial [Paracoccus sp. (in: a-proteobacteria)]